jgi:TRAP-type transport system periplasmic protein
MTKLGMFAGITSLILPVLGTQAWAQEFNMRVADSFPTTHQYSENTKEWLDLVTERTDGRVTFDYFPAEQLAKSADLLDAAQNGLADIVYAPPLYLSDRLPLSTVTALPLVGNVTDEQALNDAFQSLATNELNEAELLPLGVRAIRSLVTAPYQIMSREGQISTLGELEGQKMRSSGGVQERSVAGLGAVPVSIPAPDLYPALQRGTVDGTLFNLPTAAGYKLQEQLQYSTDNLNLGLFPVLYVINENVWQTLPEDIQTIMIEAALEVVPTVIEADKQGVEEFREGLEANGGGLYQIEDSELASWNERLEPVREEWVERLEGQNKPAQAILDRWTELVTE